MITVPFYILVAIFLVTWIYIRKRRRNAKYRSRRVVKREVMLTILFVYLVGVFYVVFEPFRFYLPDSHEMKIFTTPFKEISEQFGRNVSIAWYYVLANIVMLVPFGMLLPMLWLSFQRFGKVVAAGFAFSLSIEMTQAIFTTRSADVDDLIFNTFGAAVGYMLFVLFAKLFDVKKAFQNRTLKG